ncbi:DUF2721 domain-containing protein [Hyphomonas sp.]|uniref:DUF2721 domain-containing protein n=1 Tax=Hyphomonas sp. TaxID=87 RepID=UPI003446E9B8|nr:DUF2721 domain-containing protein [Hyphomonas sp.]
MAHIIQLAIVPVFTLAGIGALLNLMANRLARVVDRWGRWSASCRARPARTRPSAARRLTNGATRTGRPPPYRPHVLPALRSLLDTAARK